MSKKLSRPPKRFDHKFRTNSSKAWQNGSSQMPYLRKQVENYTLHLIPVMGFYAIYSFGIREWSMENAIRVFSSILINLFMKK